MDHGLKIVMNAKLRSVRFSSLLVALPLVVGFAGGCHLAFGWGAHGEFTIEACNDDYDACMADAEDDWDRSWCESDRDFCLAECPDWGGDGGGPGDGGDGGDGDGDGGDGEIPSDVPDDDETPPVCFELHASCIDQAETLQDVEACEVLFDQCADPGECDDQCPSDGCPQGHLDACLDTYAGCAGEADSQAELDACSVEFGSCTADLDLEECLEGHDPDDMQACLDQHALCVKCGDEPEHFQACMDVFDTCLGPV